MPRLFADHRARNAVVYRLHFTALRNRYGIVDRVALDFASGTAAAYASWHAVTAELGTAEQRRSTGKGRRPTSQAIERLRRRQGLEWNKYESALRRLEELTAKNQKPKTLADELGQRGAEPKP